MTSHLLRILMALIVGLWSPLCCCQAGLISGVFADRNGACSLASDQERDTPAECDCCDHPGSSRQGQVPSDRLPCNDCPACQGMLALITTQNDAGAALKSLSSVMVVLPTVAPIEWTPLLLPGQEPPLPLLPEYLARRAGGRSLLRWHCALVV